ncbi:outer membrane beta-barrel protein [Aliidiomarina soli]|uniref:Outer membrane protein beta-barrel domain-containing protein n=1 Tax=Aliidiomarina soli TaxID=1928574 RepID=A0A432WFB5_9GAMM|nr:outer membrane beta-barrel protein [Aliidiomarina soli]RUO32455.1 hypothetical protein CWE14_09920 [Aliidiomarina soli]
MKKLVQFTSLASILAASAFATASANENLEGFSVQAGVGVFTQDLSAPGFANEESGTGINLRASYNFTPRIAADVSYADFGEYEHSEAGLNETFNTSAFKVGATGFYPISDSVQLFGRVGVAFWDSEFAITESSSGESLSFSDTGNSIYWGLGGEYAFNENLTIAIEVVYLDIEPTFLNTEFENSISGTLASIKYSF